MKFEENFQFLGKGFVNIMVLLQIIVSCEEVFKKLWRNIGAQKLAFQNFWRNFAIVFRKLG